jgi:hypothetical protein
VTRSVATQLFLTHGIGRDRELIARPYDQVDRPRRGVLADLEAPEYDPRREQDLAEIFMYSVRPERVVHLEFGPEILPQMILKGSVPKYGIAEPRHILRGREVCRSDPVDRNLHTDRRLNIEVAPPFAERERRLGGQNIVCPGVPSGSDIWKKAVTI